MIPLQPPCPCCWNWCPDGCAQGRDEDDTGPCATEGCQCQGFSVDGGLCEDCYLATK